MNPSVGPLWPLISQLVNKSAPTARLRLFEIQFGSRPLCTFNLDSLGGRQAYAERALTLTSSGVRHPPLCLTGEMSWNWGFVSQSHLIISFRPFGLNVPGDGAGSAQGIWRESDQSRSFGQTLPFWRGCTPSFLSQQGCLGLARRRLGDVLLPSVFLQMSLALNWQSAQLYVISGGVFLFQLSEFSFCLHANHFLLGIGH